jgi:hypothetical protein
MKRLVRWMAGLVLLAGAGLALVVLGFALLARSKHPDLAVWHRLELREEFHAGRADVTS